MNFTVFGSLFLAAAAAPACSASSSSESNDSTSLSDELNVESASCSGGIGLCIRSLFITVVGEAAFNEPGDPISYNSNTTPFQAVKFGGTAGDAVDITVSADHGTARAFLADSEFNLLALIPVTNGKAHLATTLTETGSAKYYIIFRSGDLAPATITINLQGPETSFQSTRIASSDIDQNLVTASRLFHYGDFMFGDHEFTVEEGLGNALLPPLGGTNPRPNSKKIHSGKFGGPDAKTCSECHSTGGTDGTGDVAHNLLQDGDGVNLSTALPRQPRQVIGVGALQQLGIEMTAELQGQLAAAKGSAASSQANVTANLTSKGVGFGSVTAHPDGTVDFSQLQGLDSDLVLKPLGWKGRVANARRFVEGGFQVHLGMASQALIAKNCGPTPIKGTVGDGPDCADPDNDGVRDEITESQLTEMALYATLLQMPVRVRPNSLGAIVDAAAGEALFNQVQCNSCHQSSMTLNSTVHLEAPDLSGGAPFRVDLAVDGRLPRLKKNADGSATVELFSDLKRHDMGAALTDSHSTFGAFAPNLWLTSPLWGVAASAPYLHDGRAATLRDAITLHEGEGAASKNQFLALSTADQNRIITFLSTLGRDPQHNDD